jgi:hypothetical protein
MKREDVKREKTQTGRDPVTSHVSRFNDLRSAFEAD